VSVLPRWATCSATFRLPIRRDIDAAVTDLEEQGIEVHRIPFIPGAGHQAFLHDPFGNLLELNQPE
jgi:Glyoxalase/Bleomycin resistance protein/Dioxygenase superfamily